MWMSCFQDLGGDHVVDTLTLTTDGAVRRNGPMLGVVASDGPLGRRNTNCNTEDKSHTRDTQSCRVQ